MKHNSWLIVALLLSLLLCACGTTPENAETTTTVATESVFETEPEWLSEDLIDEAILYLFPLEEEKNVPLAQELLLPLVERGNAEAQYYWGYIYDWEIDANNGGGEKESLYWYELAAEQGFPKAYLAAALNEYIDSEEKAYNLIIKAEQAGIFQLSPEELGVDGCAFVISYYLDKKDYNTASEWYGKATDAGYADALHQMGFSYKIGYSTTLDYEPNIEWYNKAAVSGSIDAMYDLGCLYKEGKYIEQNYETAMEWFIQAYTNGYDGAERQINEMLSNKQGVNTYFEHYGELIFTNPEGYTSYLNLEDQNNVQNKARFLFQDDYYYGQDWMSDGKSQFVRSDLKSGSALILDNGWARNIYIHDGNIYYQIYNENATTLESGTFRIIMENGHYIKREKIADAIGTMQIKGEYIYYSDNPSDYSGQTSGISDHEAHLYRCDLDGNNVVEVIAKPVFFPYVFNNGILYQDDRDGESLHMYYWDGRGDIKINNQRSYYPVFNGEYIYYVSPVDSNGNESDDYTIWKTKIDGTENQQVSNVAISDSLLVLEDYIFSINKNGQVFRMKKDGTEYKVISHDTNSLYLQYINGMIKYTKYANNYEYIDANVFCDIEGKNKWEFDA